MRSELVIAINSFPIEVEKILVFMVSWSDDQRKMSFLIRFSRYLK